MMLGEIARGNAVRKSLVALLCLGLQPFLTVNEASACTAFLVADKNVVLFGNNEDFWNPLIKMWFVPAGEGTYGRVYFGYDDYFPQGGMNERGLVFDGFATEPRKVTKSAGKPRYVGHILNDAMAKCATVGEVIELFEKHNLEFMERCMFMFADRSGDAVIIEGDEFIRKDGRFQIITNFYQSQYENVGDYPCPRYQTAHKMLSESEEFSVDLCKRVLDAVHAERVAHTLYSNVYDLNKGLVYLYHFHNFENVVVIDLAEELKKGEHYVDIPSLFPASPEWESLAKKMLASVEKRRAGRKVVEVEPKFLAAYVGKYEIPEEISPDSYLTITLEDGKLYCHSKHEPHKEMLPVSPTDFYYSLYLCDVDFSFIREGPGPATAVEVKMAGTQARCERAE
jgi:penicillin V acylase-like amidase (Ntn superfamily)